MKLELNKKEVKDFVNTKRTMFMKTKAKFVVLPKRRQDGRDFTINFKQAEAMVKANDFWMEVE
jgi:hypothetical protein